MRFSTVALTLALATAAAVAAESHFQTPTTARAQQTHELLSSAAHAVNASNQSVSGLWVFPTAQSDTVFAQYDEGSSQVKHLEVLTLKGDRIVDRHDLMRSGR